MIGLLFHKQSMPLGFILFYKVKTTTKSLLKDRMCTFNLSPGEADAEGSLWLRGHPGLYSETLS